MKKATFIVSLLMLTLFGMAQVTSNAVSLSFTSSPTITTQPANVSQCQGTDVVLTVAATGESLTYQWRKTGAAIPGATGSTYTISDAQPTDAGNYSVVVESPCGSVTSNSAYVTILVQPQITMQPVSQIKCLGSAFSFSVAATGSGIMYQWQKNGVNIPGATSSIYNKTVAVAEDAGSYQVVVTGTCSN